MNQENEKRGVDILNEDGSPKSLVQIIMEANPKHVERVVKDIKASTAIGYENPTLEMLKNEALWFYFRGYKDGLLGRGA